jgi:hypothetical protein
LRALGRAENPEEKQVLAKLKEINAVKSKLQEKPVPFQIEVKKILPRPELKKQFSMEDEDREFGNIMATESSGLGEADL